MAEIVPEIQTELELTRMDYVRQSVEKLLGERMRGDEGATTYGIAIAGGLGVLVFAVGMGIAAKHGLIDLPGFPGLPDGGKSDPSAQGEIHYQGQKVETASTNFLVQLGEGTAIVGAHGQQGWDQPGNFKDGDFILGNNGYVHVDDPDDHSKPAMINVTMGYCADGVAESQFTTDEQGNKTYSAINYNVGTLAVCSGVTPLEGNGKYFRVSRRVPDQNFIGDFQDYVAHATEIMAEAAPCPTKQLEQFQTDEYNHFVQVTVAAKMGVDPSIVTVTGAKLGESSDVTKDELRNDLEDIANVRDPKNPDKTYKGMDLDYLGTDGSAVDDSCFIDRNPVPIDKLGDAIAAAGTNPNLHGRL